MQKLTTAEMDRLTVAEFQEKEKQKIVLVLDNLRSMHNVGSAFRTADAFLVEKMLLCGITGTPPHREIQKTALGATESVQWSHHADTLEALKELKAQGYTLVALEQTTASLPLHLFLPNAEAKYAFIFGNEVYGVQQEVVNMADICVEIPQFGTKHSFNVSVSIGIILWDFFSKTH